MAALANHRLGDQLQADFDALHGGEEIGLHGGVIGAGIDHGGVELLVTQDLLNAGDRAACGEELGGAGMTQTVSVEMDADLWFGRWERRIAKRESMLSHLCQA